jgi:hypothetical protein
MILCWLRAQYCACFLSVSKDVYGLVTFSANPQYLVKSMVPPSTSLMDIKGALYRVDIEHQLLVE